MLLLSLKPPLVIDRRPRSLALLQQRPLKMPVEVREDAILPSEGAVVWSDEAAGVEEMVSPRPWQGPGTR